MWIPGVVGLEVVILRHLLFSLCPVGCRSSIVASRNWAKESWDCPEEAELDKAWHRITTAKQAKDAAKKLWKYRRRPPRVELLLPHQVEPATSILATLMSRRHLELTKFLPQRNQLPQQRDKDDSKPQSEDSDVVTKSDKEALNATSRATDVGKETRSGASAPDTSVAHVSGSAVKSSSYAASAEADDVHQHGTADEGLVPLQGTSKPSATSTKLGKPRMSNTGAPAATSSETDPSYDWLFKTETGLKDSHQLLWPERPDKPWSVSLTTGLDEHGKAMFGSTRDDRQKALASGDVEKHQEFLKHMSLTESNSPLEATALGHGFIPESDRVAAVDLEKRLTSSFPHIAFMARQPIDLAEKMLPRCDVCASTLLVVLAERLAGRVWWFH